jgi:hypothetical protein
MVVIEPSFEVDTKGRVLCQSHSKYPSFLQPQFSARDERLLEKQFTCKICDHYINDECYFPRSEIDKIEFDILHKSRFQCNLCGNKIDLMLTVMQKIYLEVRFNTNMPLICCECYSSLEKKNYIRSNNNRIFGSILFYLPIISFMISLFRPTIVVVVISILIVIVLKVIIKQFGHQSLFLFDLLEGRRFYKKYFRNKDKLSSP